MGLRDVLRKKDRPVSEAPVPEFTLIRSDTYSQEVVYPPGPGGSGPQPLHNNPAFLSSTSSASSPPPAQKPRRSMDIFHSSRSRSGSASSRASDATQKSARRESRLSRLGLAREPKTSEYVPADLPEIRQSGAAADADEVETQWEKRAMILAAGRPSSPGTGRAVSPGGGIGGGAAGGGARAGAVSSKAIDEDIQTAIRFHEEGNLVESTRLFGLLADPNGANNPLSQVLYGLALRHGWGCTPNPDAAVKYLSQAASNSAAVEEMALQAGLKKGGAAKGELVLAIFELANCFRHGWGIGKDPVAAKQYYETAANLGDTDAMNEVAWCYLEGFGCKKDRFASARYYRLAEKNGNKTLGNSWIWKDKYGPPEDVTAGKK